MDLLIIGGTGVLSTAVVTEALSHKYNVTIINRGNRTNKIPRGVTLLQTDARDESKVRALLSSKHYDAVIDFICYTQEQIEYSYRVFKDYASQYIFISTTCVYDTSIPGIKDEDSKKILNSWNYSINKWKCEAFLSDLARKEDKPYTIVRPCVTYDDTRIPYGIMPPYGYHGTIIKRIINGKPIITWDGGRAKWNLMRVEDFAKGVIPLVGNIKAFNQAFNISGDVAYSWMEVLNVMSEILNKKIITYDMTSNKYIDLYPERAGEISGRAFDSIISNSKIKSVVPDFRTTINLYDGIKQTIKAYEHSNYQKGFDYRFDALMDRIITKNEKSKGPNNKNLKLSYIPYSTNHSYKNKLEYYIERYKGNCVICFFLYLKRIYNHFFRR